MDDLLDNFAGQSFESQTEETFQHHFTDARLTRLEHAMPPMTATPTETSPESPTEEGYKYHFLDGSPPGSPHAMPMSSATAAPANDPFFENEPSEVKGRPGPSFVDEADYNADVDDNGDDDEDFGHEEVTHEVEYVRPTETTGGASYNESDGLVERLRRLHSQDTERDELLTVRRVH